MATRSEDGPGSPGPESAGLCMAAGVETTDAADPDGIPLWMRHPEHGYHHAGQGQMMFAFVAMTYGFSLPEFDLWLSALRDGIGKRALVERRRQAFAACFDNQDDAMLRHLEFMHLRKLAGAREDFLLPLAQQGDRARQQRTAAGFSSGAERAAERRADWDRWQQMASALASANPHLSKTAICERVGRKFGVTGRAVAKRVHGVGTERPRSTE